MHQQQERTESNAWEILEMMGNDQTKLKASDLTVLLTWNQQAKVASMKKEENLSEWLRIVEQKKVPPTSKKWINDDNQKLEEAKSDIVEMAHT